MIFWKFWKEEMDQRGKANGCRFQDAGFFCDSHESGPEGHDAHHRDAKGDGFFGGI